MKCQKYLIQRSKLVQIHLHNEPKENVWRTFLQLINKYFTSFKMIHKLLNKNKLKVRSRFHIHEYIYRSNPKM